MDPTEKATRDAPDPRTPQERFKDAMEDAVMAVEELVKDGREDRAAGLAVGIDLGVSAAFLFSLSSRDYENATRVIRAGIAHAFREDD
jgi:hypothetical protein